jgi:hypothetical protein
MSLTEGTFFRTKYGYELREEVEKAVGYILENYAACLAGEQKSCNKQQKLEQEMRKRLFEERKKFLSSSEVQEAQDAVDNATAYQKDLDRVKESIKKVYDQLDSETKSCYLGCCVNLVFVDKRTWIAMAHRNRPLFYSMFRHTGLLYSSPEHENLLRQDYKDFRDNERCPNE